MDDYLKVAREVYAAAAESPDPELCCASGGWDLPELNVPPIMRAMDYGCGSSVNPADLRGTGPVLYIGVGGGLEALQLAYFRRRPGGVIAVDPVEEMRSRAKQNLDEAARLNPWFRPAFVRILDGTAARLPADDGSVDLVAQNCLFNIFMEDDLRAALAEVHRVLRPGGRYSSCDPVAERPLPDSLRRNPTLRARCIAGCVTPGEYLAAITGAGFGRVTVRARRPYRLLLPEDHPELDLPLLLESVEVVGEKVKAPAEGPEVFSGAYVIYRGRCASIVGADGVLYRRGVPAAVSDRSAAELGRREDFLVTVLTSQGPGQGQTSLTSACCR